MSTEKKEIEPVDRALAAYNKIPYFIGAKKALSDLRKYMARISPELQEHSVSERRRRQQRLPPMSVKFF